MSKEDDAPKMVVDEIYNDSEADFTLVSSDKVAFKVYRHQLFLSPLLRDMISSLPPITSIITLTDDQIEDSEVIRYILDIISSKSEPLVWDFLGVFRNTVAFVEKYEIDLVRTALKYRLHEYLLNGGKQRYTFILAAELGDTTITAAAIRLSLDKSFGHKGLKTPRKWFDQDQLSELARTNRWRFVHGLSIMNPAAWPICELRRVPFELYILLSIVQ